MRDKETKAESVKCYFKNWTLEKEGVISDYCRRETQGQRRMCISKWKDSGLFIMTPILAMIKLGGRGNGLLKCPLCREVTEPEFKARGLGCRSLQDPCVDLFHAQPHRWMSKNVSRVTSAKVWMPFHILLSVCSATSLIPHWGSSTSVPLSPKPFVCCWSPGRQDWGIRIYCQERV